MDLFEFIQCPIFDDTKEDCSINWYCQTVVISSLLANKFRLMPTYLKLLYRDVVMTEHFIFDIVKKNFNYPVWYGKKKNKMGLYNKIWEEVLAAFLKTFDNTLFKNKDE